MIIENEKITYKNVVSKKYYCHYKDFQGAVEDFLNIILGNNLTPRGNLIFSLNNLPMDEMMYVEFFISIEESSFCGTDELTYQSYFFIDNMLLSRYTGDYQFLTEYVYAEILAYMEENELEQATPFFHEIAGDQSLQYVQIKVGVK